MTTRTLVCRVLFALPILALCAMNAQASSTQVLISHGLVTRDQGDGADLFFRGTFGGNGRTCGSCHRVDDNLGIEAEFIATLPDDDPLFVAEFPPSQGGVPGLERPALMRGFGLILENVDGLENPTVKFVMRGVPHSLSMGTSVTAPVDGRSPVERTGWSGEGAPGNGALNLFSQGAVIQHFTKTLGRVAGTDFRLPTQTELNKMEAFMRASGRTSELSLANVRMSNPSAELGRRIFNNQNTDPTIASGKCLACHFNAGANTAGGTNGNFDTGVETVPHPARNVENFPFDGGFGITPRDCNGDGINDCFGDGSFNTPPLIEAADTGPFFHNNVAETIEDAVEFYSSPQFQASPSGRFLGGINLTIQESGNVADFMRVINAGFNTDISIQRNNAGISLENNSGGSKFNQTSADGGGDVDGIRETVNRLLQLSNVEAQDAINVLAARSLHPDAVTLLQSAISKNNQAISTFSSSTRKNLMNGAVNDLKAAKAKFGSGLTLTMGQANLLF
jgi:hypothetical protein